MDIVLSGYGKMGRVIEGILLKRGHSVVKTLDNENDYESAKPIDAVCIDFSTPEAFSKNYKIIADYFAGAVVGTTGWNVIENEVREYFKKKDKPLVYASNFSPGVNIYFQALDFLAGLIAKRGDYDTYIIELHHKEKKDAPSGTAKRIQQILKDNFGKDVEATSVRSGLIKGIHETGFESEYDKITFRHEAYSRDGFALGAVIAAEWLMETPGVWKFEELLKLKFNEK